jgi:hypothetical protein
MNELEYLKSLWGPKAKRKTDLIVPQITYENNEGSLNNESWAYNVSYAFREALDIRLEQRMRNSVPYKIWTQGPLLSFKDGDLIHSQDGKKSVQVLFAREMGWDSIKEEMYQGSVVYTEFGLSGNSLTKRSEHTCTQMQFLQLLIFGQYAS